MMVLEPPVVTYMAGAASAWATSRSDKYEKADWNSVVDVFSVWRAKAFTHVEDGEERMRKVETK